MPYLIGIDIGTTNTKAVVFSLEGKVLAVASASYSALSEKPGWHELDPFLLFEATISVLKQAVGKASGEAGAGEAESGGAGSEELCGISFSCAMHSLIAVDKKGMPLTHAMTWADLRSQSYAEGLKPTEAGKRIYRQTGTPIHAMSPLCKLLWLKDNRPEIFRDATKFISIKEYIWWKLFGKYAIDHSLASATGLFDIYAFDWYAESLELAGITATRLSEPRPSTHQESALLPEWASVLGLRPGLPFIIGGSDGCLANLGSQAVRPGETTLTIGTSGAVRMTASAPRHDIQERIFNYILTDQYYVCGGATNNGGSVLQWYMENFLGKGMAGSGAVVVDTPDMSVFIEEAMSMPPGCEGLIFLPYLQGERAPLWDARAKGVFFGIRSVHTQRHFMRAVIEGICFSLFQVGVSLEETIGPVECIYASGGFIRSGAWVQLVADLFNKKVFVTNTADASAVGAAIMGWYALGKIEGFEGSAQLVQIKETYTPDEMRHRIYQQNFSVFTALYARLKDLMGII